MIIGHQKILNYLYQSAANNRLSHFYLFTGPQATGKFTISKWLAKLLSCDKLSIQSQSAVPFINLDNVDQLTSPELPKAQAGKIKFKQPCGECQNCQAIEKEIQPDVLFVRKQEKARDITIKQIRELIANLSLSTFLNKYKIAIIDQAEFLNQEASSALLKTLEEPARSAIIILVASQTANLPATIISRASLLKFNLTPVKEIIEFLIQEKKYNQAEAEIIAGLSGGRPGRAIRLAQNDLTKIKQSSFSLLNLLNANAILKFKAALQLAKDLISCKKVLDNYLRLFRDLLLIKLNLSQQLVHKHLLAELAAKSQSETIDSLAQKINYLEKFKENLRRNVNLRLGMENLLLRL